MTEPDLTTEIVGYRQWRVTPDLALRAAAHRDRATWAVGVNEAVCHRFAPVELLSSDVTEPLRHSPCEDTPGGDCECGFYALHDPNDLWYGKKAQNANSWAGMMLSTATAEEDPLVSGIIVAWGKVQVHHQGFRSQYGRIAALALPESKRDAVVARAAAAAYGVPCVPVEELPRVAAEFGATVPVEMRPDKPEPKESDLSAWQAAISGQIAGNSFHALSWGYSPPPPVPRPRSRFERKESNRQGPHDKKRAPKYQRGKPWGAW